MLILNILITGVEMDDLFNCLLIGLFVALSFDLNGHFKYLKFNVKKKKTDDLRNDRTTNNKIIVLKSDILKTLIILY